jgi:hypothetical protein
MYIAKVGRAVSVVYLHLVLAALLTVKAEHLCLVNFSRL